MVAKFQQVSYGIFLYIFRTVFGRKKIEKRLESDSSDSDDEGSKGNLKRQHPENDVEQAGKATDLLVEVC